MIRKRLRVCLKCRNFTEITQKLIQFHRKNAGIKKNSRVPNRPWILQLRGIRKHGFFVSINMGKVQWTWDGDSNASPGEKTIKKLEKSWPIIFVCTTSTTWITTTATWSSSMLVCFVYCCCWQRTGKPLLSLLGIWALLCYLAPQ